MSRMLVCTWLLVIGLFVAWLVFGLSLPFLGARGDVQGREWVCLSVCCTVPCVCECVICRTWSGAGVIGCGLIGSLISSLIYI